MHIKQKPGSQEVKDRLDGISEDVFLTGSLVDTLRCFANVCVTQRTSDVVIPSGMALLIVLLSHEIWLALCSSTAVLTEVLQPSASIHAAGRDDINTQNILSFCYQTFTVLKEKVSQRICILLFSTEFVKWMRSCLVWYLSWTMPHNLVMTEGMAKKLAMHHSGVWEIKFQ